MNLAVFATHPIQYHLPWYRALSDREEIDLVVYYALLPSAREQGIGFDVAFEWDLPMLEGYRWERLPNAAARPSLRGFFASRTPGVGRVLDRDRPDVVLVTGWQSLPLVQALLASRRRGIPTVLRAESSALKPRRVWVRAIHRLLLSRFDAFLAIGRSNRSFYRENGVDAGRIFDAPYFVDNDRFLEASRRYAAERAEIRRSWGIGADATCFLFAGKLVPKKRVLDLLRALALAVGSGPTLHLLVVGSGEEMDGAREFATREELPVTFAGFLNQTEMGRAYAAADCLVLPSDYDETWGLVVNEAMMSGRPAIVSDRVGCGPDLVLEGETGWTFPFGDVRALARRIVEAASDPERLVRMGERGRERVRREYSVEKAVKGTIEAVAFAGSGPSAVPVG